MRYRWLVIAVVTVLVVVATAGAQFLTVSSNYRNLFSEDNPQLLAFDNLEATYTASNRILIAVAPEQGTVFTRQALTAIEELTELAWTAPYSVRVDSLTNYSHSESFEDDLIVEPLVENAQDLTDEDLKRVESNAMNAIELVGRMLARDGKAAGVVINFAIPEDLHKEPEVVEFIRATLDAQRAKYPDINYYFTGQVALGAALEKATQDDLARLLPIMFGVIVLLAIILLRSVWGVLAMIAIIVYSVLTTMGFAGWNRAELTGINAGIPLIVMVMVVAHTIHIFNAIQFQLRAGLERDAAIMAAMKSNARPVFLTSVTTAIGFLSLNASDSPPFHTLGNYVAFGVMCGYVYSMVLLPAILSFTPLKVHRTSHWQSGFFDRLGEFVIARQKLLTWSFVMIAALTVVGIFRIELSDNWTKYLDDRYEFRRHADFINANLTGMDALEYSLSSGSEGGITNPDYLRAVENFAQWFRSQPEVTYVQAFPDIMKRLNRNMHGDNDEFYTTPDNQQLAAQYLLLYELSLPFGSDLNNRIDVAKSSTRMSVILKNLSSIEQRQLDERAQAWLRQNEPQLATPVSGFTIIFSYISKRNIEGMLYGTSIAMLLVSLILMGVFRSVKLGLMSLLPNFFPALLSLGLWGFLYGRIGVAAAVTIAVVFGIVVDDTIHFMTKYIRSRKGGKSAVDSIRTTFRTVGPALWTTSIVLTAGYLVFATSGFETSWSMGFLVALTIVCAIAADFLLLPPLLLAVDRFTRKSATTGV